MCVPRVSRTLKRLTTLMRIPLFAHDANSGIDAPLCYKSRTAVVRLLSERKAFLLLDKKGREWAVQFVDLTKSLKSATPGPDKKSVVPALSHFADKLAFALAGTSIASVTLDSIPDEIYPTSEGQSDACISFSECKANVGEIDEGTSPHEILRAQAKIAAWPHIEDDKNPLARGSWIA